MRWSLGIGLALVVLTSYGQNTDALSLKDLVSGTLSGNYEIAIAGYEAELSELKGEDTGSELLPHINFQSSYFNYIIEVPQYIFSGPQSTIISDGAVTGNYPVDLGLKHNLTADLSLRQRIFDVRFFGAKTGNAQLSDLNESRLDQKRAEVIVDVAEAYFQLQWSLTNQSIIAFNRDRLLQLLEIVRRQIENEMATSFDSIRISKELRSLDIQSKQLDNGLDLLLRRLRQLTKMQVSTTTQWSTPLASSLLNTSADLVEQASPESRTLDHALSLNELQQKANRLSGVPTVDFMGHFYWLSQSPSINVVGDGFWNNMSTLGLQLSVPIYNGEELNREGQRLKLEASMLELRREQLSEGQNLQLQKFQSDVDFGRANLELEQEWLQHLQQEMQVQELRFQQDLIGINDLLETRAELMQSQQQINSYQRDLRLAEVQILKLQGQLLESIMGYED